MDLDGIFSDFSTGGATFCTCTLIAPDAVSSAGHCFDNDGSALDLGANAAIPAGGARVNFGPGSGVAPILNNGGRTDQVLAASATMGRPNDFAIVTLADAAPFSPLGILPRNARANDTNFAVGYGVAAGNNGMNAARAPGTPVNAVANFPQHNNGAKNWSTINVDDITGMFDINGNAVNGNVEQDQVNPEDWTETGDSGGPGLQKIFTMPGRAWGSAVQRKSRGRFVMSAVSGGVTPSAPNSANAATIDYVPGADAPPPGEPDLGDAGTDDFWTRLDAERNFINTNAPLSMTPDSIQIFHNLPNDPSTLAPTDQVAVFVRGSWAVSRLFGLVDDYVLHVNVWDEDVQPFPGPAFSFGGNVELAPTPFADDLVGFGFSAGSFAGLETDVVAWDIRPASAIFPYDEAGNPLDPPLDWTFQVNYGDVNQFTNASPQVTATNFAAIQAQIAAAQVEIVSGITVRGGLSLPVPEPATAVCLALGALVAVGMIRRRWSD